MKYYKITDNGQTRGETQWGEGVTHRAKKGKMELCTNTCIHCYSHPLMASFFNCIHGNCKNSQLWESEVKGKTITDNCKVGCKQLTTLKQVDLPEITTEQRITIAIKCALKVYQEPSFVQWANDWLSGEDRTKEAANASAWAAAEADWISSWASAAYWAAGTASTAGATYWAAATVDWAYWVTWATIARAGADATRAAIARAGADIDILSIIKEVMEEK